MIFFHFDKGCGRRSLPPSLAASLRPPSTLVPFKTWKSLVCGCSLFSVYATFGYVCPGVTSRCSEERKFYFLTDRSKEEEELLHE